MKRILVAVAALGSLAACTYVEERPSNRSSGYGYGYNSAPAASSGGGYRNGSYEAERQAYEYGRRDGTTSSRSWWR